MWVLHVEDMRCSCYLFHFFTLWLLLELNDSDGFGAAGPLDESLTPHLMYKLVKNGGRFFSRHLVIPQLLACLIGGALRVSHQAALFIVHLPRKWNTLRAQMQWN